MKEFLQQLKDKYPVKSVSFWDQISLRLKEIDEIKDFSNSPYSRNELLELLEETVRRKCLLDLNREASKQGLLHLDELCNQLTSSVDNFASALDSYFVANSQLCDKVEELRAIIELYVNVQSSGKIAVN